MMNRISRRVALGAAAGVIVSAGSGSASEGRVLKGRIHQSVSRWCYGKFSLEELCERVKAMGMLGVDLLKEEEWPTVAKYGLMTTMAYGIGSIADGWNESKNHDRLVMEAERMIPKVAAAGLPNIITFSGNRRGKTDAEGMDNCVIGLKRIAKLAEQNRVTVCMELLNSRHDHKDYNCDHTSWGVEVCKRVGSDRIKLLYDIYHMQIMDGDVCATIKENIAYLGHFHTGGVPGRHEIDDTQELNYSRVCKAIVDAGFTGYIAHEFVPSRDPMTSLQQAVQICDV